MRSNRAKQDGLETLRFAASFFLSEAAGDDIRSVSDESRPAGGESSSPPLVENRADVSLLRILMSGSKQLRIRFCRIWVSMGQ